MLMGELEKDDLDQVIRSLEARSLRERKIFLAETAERFGISSNQLRLMVIEEKKKRRDCKREELDRFRAIAAG